MTPKTVPTRTPAPDLSSRAPRLDLEPGRGSALGPTARVEVQLEPDDALEHEVSIALRLDREVLLSAQIRQAQAEASSDLEEVFFANFAAIAADAEGFHTMMRTAFGEGYDRNVAEALRVRTLRGDRSWLPNIVWNSEQNMNGGLGAFEKESGTVYLSETLLEEPMLALAVYAEEVGHAIDDRVNVHDAAGDEGEIFRRLLSGENLNPSEVAAIRAENDHGVITVDGQKVEVEFFIKKIRRAAGGVWRGAKKALGNAGRKIASGLTRAGDGVFAFVRDSGSALGQLLRGRPGDAIDRLARGLHSLGLGLFDGVSELVDAPLELMGPLRRPLKRLKQRAFDTIRPLVDGGLGATLGLIRGGSEGLLRIGRGVWELARGRFEEAAESLGKGLLQTFINTPINASILALGKSVASLQTLLGAEAAGRSLTEEEIAVAREVFGDSIDYNAVRIKTGDAGLFSVGGNDRPFVLGNTIYFKDRALFESLSKDQDRTAYLEAKGLFIHEMMHVWQYQNGGNDYLIESLYRQARADDDEAYVWEDSVPQTPWHRLQVEQQAKMLENAVDKGFFDGKTRFVYNGVDYTDYLKRYLKDLRRGRRAP
ncbi:MAG: hypothetical protein AAFZ38_03195 [Myxococcota bacterium]